MAHNVVMMTLYGFYSLEVETTHVKKIINTVNLNIKQIPYINTNLLLSIHYITRD